MQTNRSLLGVLVFSELHLKDGQDVWGSQSVPEAMAERGPRANLGTCCCWAGGSWTASPGGAPSLGAPLEETPVPSEGLKWGWGLEAGQAAEGLSLTRAPSGQ